MPLITYAQMREVHSIENRLGRPQLRHQIAFRSHDNATILGLAAELEQRAARLQLGG